MNERIKKLAFEAMSVNQKVSDDSFFVEVSKLKEFEKFAELIVKDVRWVMQTAADDFILDENYDAVKGVGRCMRRVKQHFGVQE